MLSGRGSLQALHSLARWGTSPCAPTAPAPPPGLETGSTTPRNSSSGGYSTSPKCSGTPLAERGGPARGALDSPLGLIQTGDSSAGCRSPLIEIPLGAQPPSLSHRTSRPLAGQSDLSTDLPASYGLRASEPRSVRLKGSSPMPRRHINARPRLLPHPDDQAFFRNLAASLHRLHWFPRQSA